MFSIGMVSFPTAVAIAAMFGAGLSLVVETPAAMPVRGLAKAAANLTAAP
jgi:hypothetical protein